MFSGDAEKAMRLYTEVFLNSRIESADKNGAGEDGPEGTVRVAILSLVEQMIMFIDSSVKADFSFTPATSTYVACDDAEATEQYLNALSDGGEILMPPGEYPFSKEFAWFNDKFGVSWQLATT